VTADRRCYGISVHVSRTHDHRHFWSAHRFWNSIAIIGYRRKRGDYCPPPRPAQSPIIYMYVCSPSHSRCLQSTYTSIPEAYLIMVVSLSLRLIATPWLDLSGRTNAETQSQPLLLSRTHRSTGCKCSVAFSGAWPTWPHTPCHAPGKECPSPALHVSFR